MDTKLMVTAIGLIFAGVLMYGQYTKIAKTPGMTTLSRATLAFRLVISVLSIGLSIYGVFNSVFDFLVNNGATKVVATSVATTLAVFVATALEYLLVNSEKALYESWFYGLKKFISIALVVFFAQSMNYATMRANATALFNKLFTKESKIVDSMILDTSKFVLAENKKSIQSLREELASLKVDSENIYKKSKGYVTYTKLIKREHKLANSKKLKELKAQGNKWAKEQIAKHLAKEQRYKARLKELKAKAEAKANTLLANKKAKIQAKIDNLLTKTVELSKDTIDTRNAKLAKVKEKAEQNSSHFGSLALAIVITSVFLMIVHSMTSDTTLIEAKENAIRQKTKDVELQERLNNLEYQLALANKNYSTIGENRSDTNKPSLDQLQSVESTDKPEQTVSSLGLSQEPNKEVEAIDYNEELWNIAKSAAIDGIHPTRNAMRDLAKGYNLDTSNWTEKYKAYLAAITADSRVRLDGKKYIIVGEKEDAVA